MNKNEYVKLLLDRLTYMLKENEIYRSEYDKLVKKAPKFSFNNPQPNTSFFNNLSDKEKKIYWSSGYKYSSAAIQRIRIELNTVLLEIEKGDK